MAVSLPERDNMSITAGDRTKQSKIQKYKNNKNLLNLANTAINTQESA